ncbi:MAG: NAD(P)-binding domain-containing protein [Caldilineaceae bacterium]|nr:NAD(P)-binding domain-containing protein [Caldilineaceae bacterium]
MTSQSLPIAIIGAGPIGLAAAAHCIQRGETPIIFEAGADIAANVRSWGHVHLFSPWRWCVDKAAVALLERHGWQQPELDALPTGHALIDAYLQPLAQTPEIRSQLHLNTRVVAVSRRRIDKMKDMSRADAPFVVQVEHQGEEARFWARAVIDASGTWATPNPIGADGLLAPGEKTNAAQISYGIPDVLGTKRSRYAGKRVAVVGGGHSAINAILELMDLHDTHPTTQLTWILRKANVAATYGGLGDDQLPGRGRLGMRIKTLVERGAVEVVTPFFTTRLEQTREGLRLMGDTPQGERAILVDEVISATGSRPDLSFLREVRLDLHPSVEAPSAIAPLIDPNVHSCGSVPPHGEKALRHPEPGFYMVGMKSYGRAPTFLLATGYEQVRSVIAGLAGDWEAAADVQLALPETGVCGVPDTVDANGFGLGSACCGSQPTPHATTLIPLQLTPLSLTPTFATDRTLSPVTREASCCGVTACCTDGAPVTADACCTPASKASATAESTTMKRQACCD